MLDDNSLNPEDAAALEKIIEKLRAEGKITHAPGSAAQPSSAASSSVTVETDVEPESSDSSQDTTIDSSQDEEDILSSWDDEPVVEATPAIQHEEQLEDATPNKVDMPATAENVDSDAVAASISNEASTTAPDAEPETIPEPEPQAGSWEDWDSSPISAVTEDDEDKAIVVSRRTITPKSESDLAPAAPETPTPWVLQQFFDGDIDLDVELQKRFPFMPLLVTAKFRSLGSQNRRKVATLTTADSSASLIIDADMQTKIIQLSFTFGSMLTLRFSVKDLSNIDRTRWLELMRREQGGLAFLWGPTRWEDDYMICISRTYSTNFYAFSPSNFEAAIRITPSLTKQLLDWLDAIWSEADEEDAPDSPLLTW